MSYYILDKVRYLNMEVQGDFDDDVAVEEDAPVRVLRSNTAIEEIEKKESSDDKGEKNSADGDADSVTSSEDSDSEPGSKTPVDSDSEESCGDSESCAPSGEHDSISDSEDAGSQADVAEGKQVDEKQAAKDSDQAESPMGPVNKLSANVLEDISGSKVLDSVKEIQGKMARVQSLSKQLDQMKSYPKELYLVTTNLVADLADCQRSLRNFQSMNAKLDEYIAKLKRILDSNKQIARPLGSNSFLRKKIDKQFENEYAARTFWYHNFGVVDEVDTYNFITVLLERSGNRPYKFASREKHIIYRTIMDVVDNDNDGSVNPPEFVTFLKLFGPIRRCVEKMVGSVIEFEPFSPANHEKEPARLYPWFTWKSLDRFDIIEMFPGRRVGTFVVRQSSVGGRFAISVNLAGKRLLHSQIFNTPAGYYLDASKENRVYYPNLAELVRDKQILSHPFTAPFQKIRFNVSGRDFKTYLGPFSKYPRSVLGLMLRGPWDEERELFFDNNPDVFQKLLDFYRYGRIKISDPDDLDLILKEFEYFGLPVKVEEKDDDKLNIFKNQKKSKILKKYEIVGEYKGGQAAAVRRAVCKHDGCAVVLKIAKNEADYKREEGNLKRLGGSIAPKYLDGSSKELVLVMEQGEHDMRTAMDCGAMRNPANLKMLVTHLAGILKKLEEQKLVHCDVKPENIVEIKFVGWKLIDFDLMVSKGQIRKGLAPRYAAPEVVAMSESDRPCKAAVNQDIWSFGVILLECLTNRPLFKDDQDAIIQLSSLTFSGQDLDYPERDNTDPAFKLVNQMLKTKPSERCSAAFIANSSYAGGSGTQEIVTEIRSQFSKQNEKLDEISQQIADVQQQIRELGLDIFEKLPNHLPRLFIVLPNALFKKQKEGVKGVWNQWASNVKDVFKEEWRVLLMCEGNDMFSDCHINPSHDGYVVSLNKEWLQKTLPIIKIGLKVVSIVVQMGTYGAIDLGPICDLLPDNMGQDDLQTRLLKVSEGLDESASLKDNRFKGLNDEMINDSLKDKGVLQESVQTLKSLLKNELDPTGGLTQMYNANNQLVWVCEKHREGLTGHAKKEHIRAMSNMHLPKGMKERLRGEEFEEKQDQESSDEVNLTSFINDEVEGDDLRKRTKSKEKKGKRKKWYQLKSKNKSAEG